jgi:hypothetical protein
MRTIVHVGWMLAAAVSVAGCTATAATSASAGGNAAVGSSASAQPSGSRTSAPAQSAPASAAALVPPSAAGTPAAGTPAGGAPAGTATGGAPTGAASQWPGTTAGPLGLLPIPSGASSWTDNTNALMSLDAFIGKFYDPSSQAGEKSLYTQRGFVSGAFEGWINADGTQQSIAIARFASAAGATSAFDDLRNSLRQDPAPSTAFTDPADNAVGSADPKLDSDGNAFVDVTTRVGDDLVDVHEFSAASPDSAAAKALLLKQVEALTSDSSAG